MFTYSLLPIFKVSHLKFLESSVPWDKTSIALVRWDLTFKQILIKNPKNQVLLSQSFKTLSEWGKSDTWSSNGNDFKI